MLGLANFVAFLCMLGWASAFFDEYGLVRADCDYWAECAAPGRGAV